MELVDLTLKDISGKKIVAVRFTPTNYLTFPVTDCESPQVPGYPAVSLSYYSSLEDVTLAIAEKYKELNYMPKFMNEGLYGVR